MNPVNFLAPLACVVAVLFGLQIAAQGKDDTNVITTNLYDLNPTIQQQLIDQIGKELHASNLYLLMASYFGQDNVNLLGLKKFFMENSREEKQHADKLVDYLNSRNGRITTIKVADAKYGGGTAFQALSDALSLEKDVTRNLMDLHKASSNNKGPDVHLTDYLESEILREQVESMRKLQGYISQLKRMAGEQNDKMAEYLLDRQLKGE